MNLISVTRTYGVPTSFLATIIAFFSEFQDSEDLIDLLSEYGPGHPTSSVTLILHIVHTSQPSTPRINCFLPNIPLRVVKHLHQPLQNIPLKR
jgi:hypothetical protein